MPEFDIDAALTPANQPVFTNYRYATHRDQEYCEAAVGTRPYLMGMICNDTNLVIVQLMNGQYLTRWLGTTYQTPSFEDAIKWLRAANQGFVNARV
mgnify:CR=1 FL=1